jgi:hypothetical protein
VALAACTGQAETPAEPATIVAAASTSEIFVDQAQDAGLDFTHFNGMSGELYIAEMMGGGAALFDFDNDGDLDIYLVQGRRLGDGEPFSESSGEPLTDRLYRNDLPPGSDGTSGVHFTDVTDSSGTLSDGYGMGVTAGDFDNDGWVDLYVTNLEANQLLRNRGDGTFEDVTVRAGVGDSRWSVAATFLDFDRDGWLDLFVGNYVQLSLASHSPCPSPSGRPDYCAPGAYPAERDSLFRNRGDGTFENVSDSAGIRTEHGAAALGAVAADFNADGWIDLYVANDSTPNYLWINQQNGTFENRALLAGVAVNQEGQPEASMGVDAGDFDGDGDPDLILAHLDQESNTVYANDGSGLFTDVSISSGLGLPSLAFTAFGAAWLDYDNDGWLDLLTVNGAVVGPDSLPQTNQLFRNSGGTLFTEVTAEAGAVFELSEVTRGAAFGDLDNDGDTDAILVNNNGPVRLLINQVGQNQRWVGLRLESGQRDALGAEVVLFRQETTIWRRVHTDGSYAAASDPRVLIGLGEEGEVRRVEIRWPDGVVEEWSDVEQATYSVLRQGEGRRLERR